MVPLQLQIFGHINILEAMLYSKLLPSSQSIYFQATNKIFLFQKALNKFDKHGKIFTCRVVVEFVVIVRLRNIVSS